MKSYKKESIVSEKIKRRDFLHGAVTTAAIMATVGTGLVRPRLALADDVQGWPAKAFDAKTLSEALKGAGVPVTVPASSKVHLSVPTIAENGGAVPLSVDVDSPMTADDYIETIYLFVDKNPLPLASQFNFTPANGKASMQERIKMAKTSSVRVVAKTNKGELLGAVKLVKVTVGGCG